MRDTEIMFRLADKLDQKASELRTYADHQVRLAGGVGSVGEYWYERSSVLNDVGAIVRQVAAEACDAGAKEQGDGKR